MLHESITKVANLVVHDGTVGQPTFEFAHATHVGLSEDWRCVQFVCAKECEFAQRVLECNHAAHWIKTHSG